MDIAKSLTLGSIIVLLGIAIYTGIHHDQHGPAIQQQDFSVCKENAYEKLTGNSHPAPAASIPQLPFVSIALYIDACMEIKGHNLVNVDDLEYCSEGSRVAECYD